MDCLERRPDLARGRRAPLLGPAFELLAQRVLREALAEPLLGGAQLLAAVVLAFVRIPKTEPGVAEESGDSLAA